MADMPKDRLRGFVRPFAIIVESITQDLSRFEKVKEDVGYLYQRDTSPCSYALTLKRFIWKR